MLLIIIIGIIAGRKFAGLIAVGQIIVGGEAGGQKYVSIYLLRLPLCVCSDSGESQLK